MKTKNNKPVIGLINPQGHVRWNNLQIAEHPDTGGQIVYILELSKELAKSGCRIDIFTRFYDDKNWPGYNKLMEKLNDNLRIIRIKCGPENKFLKKEDLWSVINIFTCGIVDFYENKGYKPDIFWSNYGDAGLAAAILKEKTGIPFIHTGHSLGGQKIDKLKINRNNFKVINDKFRFHFRIAAERIANRNSSAIITSTGEEIKKQYGHKIYGGSLSGAKKFNVIPPGIAPSTFFSYLLKENKIEMYNKAVIKMKSLLARSIENSRLDLPCIYSASRLDAKKNPTGLLKAYAISKKLQGMANLFIVAGKTNDPINKNNYKKLKENEKIIVDEIKDIFSQYPDLTSKVCFAPGFEYTTEMPYIYRYGSRHKWVFINPALHEPFGLTVIEAMASGMPVAATKNGGPIEILDNNRYGLLINPHSSLSTARRLIKLFDKKTWNMYSERGLKRVKEKYTWGVTAKGYLKLIKETMSSASFPGKDTKIPIYFSEPNLKNENKLIARFKKLYPLR
ncbi:glycosyltransferase [Elusimicrobiota bacterium]